MTRPNILLITSDQQLWYTLGVTNPKIKTPNLDRLAARGVNFTRAYCPNPTCTPTRASLITGMYPSRHGAYTLGTKLPEDVPTLGDHLRQAGYATALVGKAHFQPLKSTPECESIEAYPTLRDLDFWRTFNDTHTPWYGFEHVELTRNHADEGHVGQHYAIWMEENGLTDWRAYYKPRNDGVRESEHDGVKAPGNGGEQPGAMHWQLPEKYHYSAWTAQRTNAAIDAAVDQGKPFFVWSSYHDPHPPYAVPEPWASMYDPADMEPGELSEGELELMPPPHRLTQEADPDFKPFNKDGLSNHGYNSHLTDREHLKQCMAIYYGMVSFMDHCIGQTLDHLDAIGQTDNTLIAFTSDHGHFLGEHGLVAKGPFHYEEVIRVPMIVAWPGQVPQGQTCDKLQSLVDYAPTFMRAAGLDVPRAMQGLDQLPCWRAPQHAVRDHVLVENHHNDSDAVHLRTLVTERYKLTVYRGREWGELFDLEDDPAEVRNRFDDPEAMELRCRLYAKLIDADLQREPAEVPRVAVA